MKILGSATICNDGPSERNQKTVKHQAQKPKHKAANFTMQVEIRSHESNLINMANNCIKDKVGNLDLEELDHAQELKMDEQYILTFGISTKPRRKEDREITIKRKDEKHKTGMDVNKNFKVVIAKHITEFKYYQGFVVSGFAKCKINHEKGELPYHANLHIAGEIWYDFCMVNFEDNMYQACIHSFFQMRLSSVPTKVLVEDEGKT